jgi:hypothetical protein
MAIGGCPSKGDEGESYLSLSYNDQLYSETITAFMPLTLSKGLIYLGNSQQIGSSGFKGQIREFLIANYYQNSADISKIKN